MSDSRTLGGAFLPPENAARLNVLRYVETALTHTLAGWIARVPELDVKIELARQVAFAAERADALWKRVAQLLWPEERDVALHPAIARLIREMDEAAPDTAGLLAGLGQVVLPRLAEAYRAHAAATDPITDAPTVRLLERLKPEVLSLAMWAVKRAAQLASADAAAGARAAAHVRRLAGCWAEATAWHAAPADGRGASLLGELARPPEGPGARVAGLARDARFRDLAPGEAPPPEPLDTPGGRLAYLLRTLNFELFAAELMGRNLYEYGRGLPWQFTLDMARQCWDEARHAEIMVERIKATGVPWQPGEPGFVPYPLDNGPWHDIYPGGLFERLVAMNRGIEALALDTHVYRFNTFEALGDLTGAATHAYIVADEAPHVGFGTRWLRYLLFHAPAAASGAGAAGDGGTAPAAREPSDARDPRQGSSTASSTGTSTAREASDARDPRGAPAAREASDARDPRQADLALVPFFPTMGQIFAPPVGALGREQLAIFERAEQQAWARIAARRAARLAAEGRADHAAGPDAAPPLGPAVLGVRRRDAVNTVARRLAGFTPEEIEGAIAAAGGAVVPADG